MRLVGGEPSQLRIAFSVVGSRPLCHRDPGARRCSESKGRQATRARMGRIQFAAMLKDWVGGLCVRYHSMGEWQRFLQPNTKDLVSTEVVQRNGSAGGYQVSTDGYEVSPSGCEASTAIPSSVIAI